MMKRANVQRCDSLKEGVELIINHVMEYNA